MSGGHLVWCRLCVDGWICIFRCLVYVPCSCKLYYVVASVCTLGKFVLLFCDH